MSPDQWDDVVEEEAGEEEPHADFQDPHDLTEAVWALWGQVDVLRQELEAERLGRERDGEAASVVMAEAIEALRGDLAHRPPSPPDGAGAAAAPAGGNVVPNALRSLSGDVERIHAALLADRAERQRYESALPAIVRKEMDRALSQEATARAQGDEATQRALKGAFDVLRADLQAALRERSSADGPTLPKVVRAALDELKFQLVEERNQREARDASIAPTLQGVDDALMALHAEFEAERSERYAVHKQAASAAELLTAQLAQLRADLERERNARAETEAELASVLHELRETTARADEAADARHVAAESNQATAVTALHDAVRQELDDVTRSLAQSDAAHSTALAEMAAALDELRRTAVEAAQAAEAEDARYAATEADQAAAIEVALNAVREELAELRTQQTARDAALLSAVTELKGELSQAREERSSDRQLREELDAADAAATETLNVRLAELRELFLQETVRQESREAALGQLRDDLVQDMLQRETGAAELRTILAAQREEDGRHVAQRQSWEAGLVGAMATVHAEVASVREALAAVQAQFAENQREQEALAFRLPEATHDLQERVTRAEAANVANLKQLEDLLRSTMSGANSWFVRTRDELVERLDHMASTVDLGIAESMVTVLEQLRVEVAGIHEDLAALGRRQHLTAAQVRKIVRETAPEGTAANGKGKVAKPARAARARPSS